MKKLRFVIIGSGYRSLFYVRIAKSLPGQFELCAMLCRTSEKAEYMRTNHQIPVSVSEEECLAMKPDFVVVSVNKTSIAAVTMAWAKKGVLVLSETPAGLQLSELNDLWRLKQECNAKIQVAEQYTRKALHAARLAVLSTGVLGDPYNINISAAHDYHGASLIRRYLGIGMEGVQLYGKQYQFPVIETDSRYGPVMDGRVVQADRMRAVFEFEGGKTAFYDFSGIQYHSFIRTTHLNVQGSKGELDDLTLRYVNENYRPECGSFQVVSNQENGMISSVCWNSETVYENPYPDSCLDEDETAVAELMAEMGHYIETGEEIYPLAEALQDAYMLILLNRAAKAPYEKISSEKQIWMK